MVEMTRLKEGRERSAGTGDNMVLDGEGLKDALGGIAEGIGTDEDTREDGYCWRVYDLGRGTKTHWTKDHTASLKQSSDTDRRLMTIIYWDE